MIAKKVIRIAQELFSNNTIDINNKIGDIDEWDSLGHINLFMAIENEFSINFDLDEVLENDSISKIVELLNNKTQGAL